jgi:hypothetical protein
MKRDDLSSLFLIDCLVDGSVLSSNLLIIFLNVSNFTSSVCEARCIY